MKLSTNELHAIVSLKTNTDHGVLINAVASHCSLLNERLIKQPVGDEYLRGMVAAYSELLEDVNTATSKLERVQRPKT